MTPRTALQNAFRSMADSQEAALVPLEPSAAELAAHALIDCEYALKQLATIRASFVMDTQDRVARAINALERVKEALEQASK